MNKFILKLCLLVSFTSAFLWNIHNKPNGTTGTTTNGDLLKVPAPQITSADDLSSIIDHPYIVSVHIKDEGHICAGTIINPQWILTAADCVINANGHMPYPSIFGISYGTSNLATNEGIIVKKIEVYPVFVKGRPVYDVALLYINSPIMYTVYSSPINIATKKALKNRYPHIAFQSVLCHSSGWGDKRDGELYENTFILSSNEDCETDFKFGKEETVNITLCTKPTHTEVCNLDVGSPLICNDIQVGLLAGVSKGCSRLSRIWTRIDIMDSWIKAKIIKKKMENEKSSIYNDPLQYIQIKSSSLSIFYNKSILFVTFLVFNFK